jgi:hypothetical protein
MSKPSLRSLVALAITNLCLAGLSLALWVER